MIWPTVAPFSAQACLVLIGNIFWIDLLLLNHGFNRIKSEALAI